MEPLSIGAVYVVRWKVMRNIMKTQSVRRVAILLCLAVLQIVPLEAQGDDRRGAAFVLGVSQKTFVDVDIKDGAAALKIYAEELGRQFGYDAQSKVYTDVEAMVRDVQSGTLDMLSVTTMEYFRIRGRVDGEMGVVHVRGGRSTSRYLVLVRNDARILGVEDLKGKKLSVLKGDELGRLFLNTLLLKQRFLEIAGFFSFVEERSKPSQAILSVFFGQTDACIVDDYAFTTMVELNPQVGTQLKVLASSPELYTSVCFFRRSCDEDLKQRARAMPRVLQETARGRQVFLLFKIEGILSIKESDLETTRKLVADYERLKGRL
jgi:ABC-type phosphate/phosphonate transport system substrate-binding protein